MDNDVLQGLFQSNLTLDQTDAPIELDHSEVENYYYPLACKLIDFAQGRKRFLVAVAGPPGSGKTVFTTILVTVVNTVVNHEIAISIPLDGWHYPNEYLLTHTLQRSGVEVVLKQIKGSPETYDTTSAFQCIEKVKAGEEVRYPIYSRILHDPVQNGGTVLAQHRIVIMEGNYLLLREEPWQSYRHLFDICIMLIAQREKLIDGLRRRHLRGLKSTETTDRHINNVDLPNIDRVINHSRQADIMVHKADNQHIIDVVYSHS